MSGRWGPCRRSGAPRSDLRKVDICEREEKLEVNLAGARRILNTEGEAYVNFLSWPLAQADTRDDLIFSSYE